MDLRIWKYRLVTGWEQTIMLPKGARILHLREQHNVPCMWVLADPDAVEESVVFLTCTTGDMEIGIGIEELEYIGTYQLFGGDFVGHVFRRK